jgi:hypothetical protein
MTDPTDALAAALRKTQRWTTRPSGSVMRPHDPAEVADALAADGWHLVNRDTLAAHRSFSRGRTLYCDCANWSRKGGSSLDWASHVLAPT